MGFRKHVSLVGILMDDLKKWERRAEIAVSITLAIWITGAILWLKWKGYL